MAWTYYRDLGRKIGASLRVRALPAEVLRAAPVGEIVTNVEVSGRSSGSATLQVWSHKQGDAFKRYTVTLITLPEDGGWIVER